MARIYANLIIKGKKTIDQVPEKIRDDVKVILISSGYIDLIGGDD